MGKAVHSFRDEKKYRLLYELPYTEVMPFVMKQIRRKGTASFLFLGLNLLSLGTIVLVLILGLSQQWFPWQKLLIHIPLGLLSGGLLIIPFHELLHGLAYRLLGARKIIFGADMKQFIFFVTAHEHAVSGIQLAFLALFPFLVINSLCIAAAISLFPGAILFFAFLLLIHNLMCIGDFAMVNFACRRGKRIYSYDDPEKKLSYFFQELSPD